MRKMVEQMINSSKIHELITYSANVLLSILSALQAVAGGASCLKMLPVSAES